MINLSSVFAEPGKTVTVLCDVPLEGSLISADADVTAKAGITVLNNAGVVCAGGYVEFDYVSVCDRCAVPTKTHIKIKIDHILTDQLTDETNDDFILIANKNWDFEETVITDVILSFPSKNLCKPDCPGMCQACGCNLNEGFCDCAKTEIDPRLAKLKEFFN